MASKNIPEFINGYTTDNFLGRGSFANVFRCTKDGKTYAMKRINSEERFKRYARREINFFDNLESNRVVRLLDNFMKDEIQYLVFEYLEDNLYKYMFKKKNFPNFKTFSKYMYQISDGLSYLHEKNIVHCDLKLENVMKDKNNDLKIIDLGSSLKGNINFKNNFYIQSRYYRAPEILYEINFSNKIDIWSMGIMATEMILRTCIFNGRDTDEMIYKICDFLNIPTIDAYKYSNAYNKLFELVNGTIYYRYPANRYKVKGYRENRLEEYLINGMRTNFSDIYDYQIENTVTFIYKILDYNFNTRLSAEDCKIELVVLENEFN